MESRIFGIFGASNSEPGIRSLRDSSSPGNSSTEKGGQFFDRVHSPLAIIGFDGRLKQGNAAFRALLKPVVLADHPFWWELIHPDDRAPVRVQWQALIQRASACIAASDAAATVSQPFVSQPLQVGRIEGRLACPEPPDRSLERSVERSVERFVERNDASEILSSSDRWFVWEMTPIADEQVVYVVGQEVRREMGPQRLAETDRSQRIALQQANQELERRVAERTAQLEQVNAALTEREALYRTLARHIPNGAVLLFDRNLRYLLAEGDGLHQAGLDRSMMVGKTIQEVFPPEVSTAIEPYYRAALAGRSRVYEVPLHGQVYEAHTVPVRNEQGEIFAGMVLTQNITDRSRNETLLATQNYILELITRDASLADVLKTLAQLIETQSDQALCSILLLDQAENTLRLAASPSFPQSCYEDLAGGIPVNPIDTICGTAAHTRLPVIVPEVATESRWVKSIALLQKYGLQACWSTPILNGQGRVLGTFALYYQTPRQPDAAEQRLVTIACYLARVAIERKQAEAALQESEQRLQVILKQSEAARAQAEQANRIKDEFLAVLSHELRTPLNPILGWAKLLQNRQLSSDKVQQGLETIERNVKLQVQLIDDLLDISRILRGKLALDMVSVNLTEPIAAAMETVRLNAEAKAIQLTVQWDAPIQQVFGDASRLQQVFWNLLSNAIKFTPQGGQVSVRLSLAASAKRQLDASTEVSSKDLSEAQIVGSPPACPIPFIRIQVIDTGKGISPEFLPYVFEHFRQQDSSTTRQFGGLGLGLAIVRQLVEAHGGTVAVESAGEGQGAAFSVDLPLLLTRQPVADRKLDRPIALNLQGVNVLLVDDDEDTRSLIACLLEQQQLCVTSVSSASEALAALDNAAFDLLISDIGMPEMDGYTLMRQIRTRSPERGGNLPAIALTAYAGDSDQQQAFAAGFRTHLAKPLALETLMQAIGEQVKQTG